MNCVQCGEALPASAKFCKKCGCKVAAAVPAAALPSSGFLATSTLRRADCQPGTGASRISRFAGRAHGGLQHLPRLRGFVQRRCALLQQMRLPL